MEGIAEDFERRSGCVQLVASAFEFCDGRSCADSMLPFATQPVPRIRSRLGSNGASAYIVRSQGNSPSLLGKVKGGSRWTAHDRDECD